MTRKVAIDKLRRAEDWLRNIQATIIGYADDLREVRLKLEGKDASDGE